ncbi:unnamed protein product [Urochloa decumbens]|uniref:DUF1618 domain-containing protein n=1 Tax=Urochloa decumbens TaxID=240449 RepID=A0ABC8YQP5_9POAL
MAPPILVLQGHVDLGGLTDEPGRGWTEIECASKKAYGCGEHDGQEAVEGLKLYARLGGGSFLTSSLAIRMSDEAHRRFDSELELGSPSKDMLPCPMEADACVQMAGEQGLTAIVLAFQRPFRRGLVYYLVYDHVDASLSMIKTPCCFHQQQKEEEILGLFFHADVAFSFQGKGFWADLSQAGLVYCDLHATSDPAVDVGFIPLPPECRPNLAQMELDGSVTKGSMRLNRTLACVRDSIWFVCIHRAMEYADDLVQIWTLNDVPAPGEELQEGRWEKAEEVPVRVLWGLDSYKEAGLPHWPLECPALTPDGALCVTLVDQTRFRNRKQVMLRLDKMCIFKLHGERRLLFDGVVKDYYFSDPAICPPNFLQRKHRSSETKVGPAAGLEALEDCN